MAATDRDCDTDHDHPPEAQQTAHVVVHWAVLLLIDAATSLSKCNHDPASFQRPPTIRPAWLGPALTVIGLDSATFDVVDPLVEGGDLPNLARLLERGASGVLRSTTHPLTPHAWSTMVTGVNAGRHGIWDFTERGRDGLRAAADQRQLPPRACALGPACRGRPPRRRRQRPVQLAGARARRRLRDRRHGRLLPRAGHDRAGVALCRAARALRPARARSQLPAAERPDRSRPGAPRGGAEGAGGALARRALRAGAPLRRLHGRRPRPAPRLARVGGARRRERRRGGVPDPRRGGRRARRARGRRRRARRLRPRRGARSTASSTSMPGLPARATSPTRAPASGSAGSSSRRRSSSASACRSASAARSRTAPPGCARRSTSSEPATR